MKFFKVFVGIVLILAFVASMIFTVESIRHGLPTEGAMKGNIRAWKPIYPYEGIVVFLAAVFGIFGLLGGMMLLILTLREDFGVKTAFRK